MPRPWAGITFWNIRRTLWVSLTLPGTAMSSPSASRIIRVVSSAASRGTSAATTLAPSRGKIIAAARPMPAHAPVMTLTLPAGRTSPILVDRLLPAPPAHLDDDHDKGQRSDVTSLQVHPTRRICTLPRASYGTALTACPPGSSSARHFLERRSNS